MSNSTIPDVKKYGKERFVVPYAHQWGIKVEGEKGIEQLFSTKKEAVQKARKEAKEAHASLTIQNKNGKTEKRISYSSKKSIREEGPITVTVEKQRIVEFK